MKIFCGTDIIEIERVKESIGRVGDSFINRIFTVNEIAYCESKKELKYQHYAARFAAKEAIFKAISKGLDNKFSMEWKNLEILNDINGRPTINFVNFKIDGLKEIDISISHCKSYATATAVANIEI